MKSARLVIVCLVLVLTGCSLASPRDTVTQVSTIDALLVGGYDGQLTTGRLLQHGNVGIGTFDKLDGEMVVLDGAAYQVTVDGRVHEVPANLSTPFADVVHFRADRTVRIDQEVTYAQFTELLDWLLIDKNVFYAIRARGTFAWMKTRSVPAQEKPYLPLAEVVKDQAIFEMRDVTGAVVGFRSPPYVQGVNVPGYHLHFISDDRSSGGHVLDFIIREATVEIDLCDRFVMLLPADSAAFAQLKLGEDRSAELEKVEN